MRDLQTNLNQNSNMNLVRQRESLWAKVYPEKLRPFIRKTSKLPKNLQGTPAVVPENE